MATLGEIFVGQALEQSKNPPESQAGWQVGAELAKLRETKQQHLAQIKQKQAEIHQAKEQQMYDMFISGTKMTPDLQKNFFGTNGAFRKARDARGMNEQFPDDKLDWISRTPENLAKARSVIEDVRAGVIKPEVGFATIYNEATYPDLIPYQEQLADEVRKASEDYVRTEATKEAARLSAGQKAVEKKFNNESDLRKELTSHPISKTTFVINDNFDRINKAFTGDPSAAGDLSGIFSYMKLLDPGSTVREGEFANAQNAASVPDQIRNLYNKTTKGERLNPKQREDFLNRAKQIYLNQQTTQLNVNKQYEEIARNSGLNPKQVLVGTNLRKDEIENDFKSVTGATIPVWKLKAMELKDPNNKYVIEWKKSQKAGN